MAIFLAGKAVCCRIPAFSCYGKSHFKCESAGLWTYSDFVCLFLCRLVLPQPLDGGGFFRFVAVLRVALVAAEGCLFLSRLDLRLFEMFAVGRYAALGLLGVGARHGLLNQVGGVEGGFGRRLHGGRRSQNSRCCGAAGGSFPFGTVGFFLRVFTRFAAFVPFETRLRMGGGGKARRGFPARQAA